MSAQPYDDTLGFAVVMSLVEPDTLSPLVGDDEGRDAARALHQRLRASHPKLDVQATLNEVVVSADSDALPALLSWLRDQVVDVAADLAGRRPAATWSAGLSWGQLRSLRAADGMQHRVGVPIDDARLLSRRGAAGAILASAVAVERLADEGEPDVGLGPRLYVRGRRVGTVMDCFEVTIGDAPSRGSRPGAGPRRARGTVQRWSADRPFGFLVDDDDQFFYFDDRHLVAHAPPTVGQTVFFLPRPPLQPGRNPLAAAVIGDNDALDGVVLPRAAASPQFVRVTDKTGHHQDLHVHGPSAAPGISEGDEIRLRVMIDARGPLAADVRPAWSAMELLPPMPSDASEPTVGDRFLGALTLHLRENGAHAAGAAVRRATISRRSSRSEKPRVRRDRVLALVDHALRVWARRGLDILGADALIAGLDSLGRVVDEDDAAYAAARLADHSRYRPEGDASWDADPAPAMRSIGKALEHAGRMPPDWESSEAATEAAMASNWAGKALAEAFLAGVVTSVPLEAGAVVRRLDDVR